MINMYRREAPASDKPVVEPCGARGIQSQDHVSCILQERRRRQEKDCRQLEALCWAGSQGPGCHEGMVEGYGYLDREGVCTSGHSYIVGEVHQR